MYKMLCVAPQDATVGFALRRSDTDDANSSHDLTGNNMESMLTAHTINDYFCSHVVTLVVISWIFVPCVKFPCVHSCNKCCARVDRYPDVAVFVSGTRIHSNSTAISMAGCSTLDLAMKHR